ncbi:MAG: hypothetical protein JRN52_00830 [Nitrososphaerota archaeon]|nr:hypothetical protein [Nitrososphaerota archaeon]
MASIPHGGSLVSVEQVESTPEVTKEMLEDKSVKVSYETRVTIFNIANGIFSPLIGFVDKENYQNILPPKEFMRPEVSQVILHAEHAFVD